MDLSVWGHEAKIQMGGIFETQICYTVQFTVMLLIVKCDTNCPGRAVYCMVCGIYTQNFTHRLTYIGVHHVYFARYSLQLKEFKYNLQLQALFITAGP
jgi:hypothetical protein